MGFLRVLGEVNKLQFVLVSLLLYRVYMVCHRLLGITDSKTCSSTWYPGHLLRSTSFTHKQSST